MEPVEVPGPVEIRMLRVEATLLVSRERGVMANRLSRAAMVAQVATTKEVGLVPAGALVLATTRLPEEEEALAVATIRLPEEEALVVGATARRVEEEEVAAEATEGTVTPAEEEEGEAMEVDVVVGAAAIISGRSTEAGETATMAGEEVLVVEAVVAVTEVAVEDLAAAEEAVVSTNLEIGVAEGAGPLTAAVVAAAMGPAWTWRSSRTPSLCPTWARMSPRTSWCSTLAALGSSRRTRELVSQKSGCTRTR